jgi:hypothetical protein
MRVKLCIAISINLRKFLGIKKTIIIDILELSTKFAQTNARAYHARKLIQSSEQSTAEIQKFGQTKDLKNANPDREENYIDDYERSQLYFIDVFVFELT